MSARARFLVLAASVGLNVLLIALALQPLNRTVPGPAVILEEPTAVPDGKVADALANWRTRHRLAAEGSHRLPAWSQVHNDDLHGYVANLRAAGFPEAIVRSAVVAELDRLLAVREEPSADAPYWRTGPERDAIRSRQRRTEAAREAERREKIRELLGVEWHEVEGMRPEESLLVWLLGGVLPTEESDRLNGLWARIEDRSRTLRSSSGLVTPEIEALRRQAYEETIEELERHLGSAGLEELELRTMAVDVGDVWGSERLFGCVMTGQELREFLRIRKAAEMPLLGRFGLEPSPPDASTAQAIDDGLRALLGEERFRGYQRAKDPQFRWIHGALPTVTMELTWEVYDVYAGLKEAAGDVRDRTGMVDAERQAALDRLRVSAEAALEKVMGPEKFASYGTFEWLNQLTSKEIPAK